MIISISIPDPVVHIARSIRRWSPLLLLLIMTQAALALLMYPLLIMQLRIDVWGQWKSNVVFEGLIAASVFIFSYVILTPIFLRKGIGARWKDWMHIGFMHFLLGSLMFLSVQSLSKLSGGPCVYLVNVLFDEMVIAQCGMFRTNIQSGWFALFVLLYGASFMVSAAIIMRRRK